MQESNIVLRIEEPESSLKPATASCAVECCAKSITVTQIQYDKILFFQVESKEKGVLKAEKTIINAPFCFSNSRFIK